MRLIVNCLCALAFGLGLSAAPACLAQATPAASGDLAALTLPPVTLSELAANGRIYEIFVARPPIPPPPEGYPLLVVLDANLNFATAAGAAWLRAYYSDIAPVVVVGIGYPTRDLSTFETRRSYDLTSPSVAAETAPALAGKSTGGAEPFRQDVIAQVLEAMDRDERVNPRCHVLFGHSAGGLFVIDTLFRHPNMFEGYFAASAALHLNHFEIFSRAPTRDQWVDGLEHPVRVHLVVGDLEKSLTERQLKAFPAFRNAPATHMVENTQRVAALLSALGSQKVAVSSEIYRNESHTSEGPRAISEAITFASECAAK